MFPSPFPQFMFSSICPFKLQGWNPPDPLPLVPTGSWDSPREAHPCIYLPQRKIKGSTYHINLCLVLKLREIINWDLSSVGATSCAGGMSPGEERVAQGSA